MEKSWLSSCWFGAVASAFLAGMGLVALAADNFTGAIHTSIASGTVVNANHYEKRQDVYLNGGPQNQNSAGLPDGTYYFQVTDPSGSVLLSSDPAIHRQLQVVNGRIASATGPQPHLNGQFNPANGTTPVQLWPFDLTPNQGGEYKVWLIAQGPGTSISVSNPRVLEFDHRDAKTDNFKCRESRNPLTVTCPANLTVTTEAGVCGAAVAFTKPATQGGSGAVAVRTVPDSGSLFPVGTTTVNVLAVDAVGQVANCSFTVTVIDGEAPVINASNISVANDRGTCGAVVNFNVSAADNCGLAGLSTSVPSGSVFPVGATTVTVVAADIHGNVSNSSFTVTVRDIEPPVIAPAVASVTYECNGTGHLGELAAWLASNGGAAATDNCGAVIWSHNFTGLTAGCGGTGKATVTFTATDAHRNSSSTTATFQIIDTTAPTLSWTLFGTNVNHAVAQTIKPNQVPVSVVITATDLCKAALLNPVRVTCHAINGSGKVIDKSGSCVVTVSGGVVTILDAGGVGTFITVYASAVDECGNASAEESMVIQVSNPSSSMANEGVGNGVDGNTPGHVPNGGNDDPTFTPGNPGAKNKPKK